MSIARYLVILVVMCGLTQNASAQSRVSVERGYTVKDSGLLGRTGDRNIFWLDDQRVLFVGFKEGEKRLENTHEQPKFDLYVWNTSSGELRRHAELSSSAALCVSRDFVRFQFDRAGRRFVRSGVFGAEREVEVDMKAEKETSVAVNPLSCREYNPKLLGKRYGARGMPLLEPGEYLDRGSRDVANSMRYFPADGRDPIVLNIPPRRAVTVPRFSEHTGKYVFNEIRPRPDPSIPATVWLLERNGSVDEMKLPHGPWMRAVVRALPVQEGWVMTSTATARVTGADAAGVYHVSRGLAARVITGLPDAFSVSTDGCRVAVAIDTNLKLDGRLAVRMIDFCSKRS